eukprot:gene12881-14207_t
MLVKKEKGRLYQQLSCVVVSQQMAQLAGLCLIQSTISAIGLMLTNILWDKWQKCQVTVGDNTVIYRTGLWDRCIDHHFIGKTVCNPLDEQEKTTKLKSAGILMIVAICLQSLCVVLGLFIYRYARHRKLILIPLFINIAAGIAGLSVYAAEKRKLICELSSSYIIGWLGIGEALLCCLFFALVAVAK